MIVRVEKGSLNGVVGTIGRLEGIKQVRGGQMVAEARENNFLKDFRDKGKVRNGTIVGQVIWVKVGFLKKRSDKSRFERIWKKTRGEGEINNVSNRNGENEMEGFDKVGGNWIKGRGGGRSR
jgi:hypothetical protein